MYINTLTKEGIKESLCRIFNMEEQQLIDEINNIELNQDINKQIDTFIDKHLIYKPNEILFFHLSRRLNSMIDEYDGKPSSRLLTTENDFSCFLKKYGIEFEKTDDIINFKFKGEVIPLNWNDAAMRVRYKLLSDDCFNGHAFNNNYTNSIYNYSLENCPEIINDISNLISDNKKMVEDYMKNSTFICYIYKIPLSMVIVDNKKYNKGKIRSLIRHCILILLNKKTISDNLLLRLKDGYTLPSKYFMDKYIFKTFINLE